MQAGKQEEAVSLLRRSLLMETALVVLVIACVAWLGFCHLRSFVRSKWHISRVV